MRDNLVGARLGNYEIEAPLGSGGMAHVYLAWDTTLKRPVAIKVIEPNLINKEKYQERFEHEAQSVASLEHANIVPVYYFGKINGLYYLAMKFIEGEDLGALMNRYAVAGEYLPADDILRIIEGVASALDYAHRKGVIHRDVKPSNIMIDRDGHPYLTDFGLALNLSQGTTGDVLGSPHYISPEQARNSANAVPQSDIYSLGTVLYELFTGVLPFDDPSPTAVALQHITKEPPAPRALNPDIFPQLETVILNAMAKQPEARYQSGRELVEALRTALQNAEQEQGKIERPPLPPLPAGMQPPSPRRPSMRPVAAEVRASLAQRQPLLAEAAWDPASGTSGRRTSSPDTIQHESPATLATGVGAKRPSYLPLLVFGGVVLIVIVIVAVATSLLDRNALDVAVLPTESSPANTVPTNTVISAVNPLPSATLALVLPSPEPPTAAAMPPSPTPESPSPLPPISTSSPLITTPIPPIQEQPSVIPGLAAGPTAAPANWLPTRFIYNADAFYWMNDSNSSIRVESFVFERVDGSQRFEANRFAYYTMESGRCMQIMFVDVARNGCPEGRRPNAFFTPSRTQGVDFWTGSGGQFRVLWNNVEIAVCDIAAGQCNAYVPAR